MLNHLTRKSDKSDLAAFVASSKKRPQQPLRVMFLITSMPVGGAETLLVNLVRCFDRQRIEPLIACLKEPGELGEVIRKEVPLYDSLIGGKFDIRVILRLRKLFRYEQVDAVITVGAGDKMFWGRMAAKYAGVPVILSALHSTGWPDGVGKLNRMLTPITDGFIAVAGDHREFLIDFEKFPEHKVRLIPNGIDSSRFVFNGEARSQFRKEYGIPEHAPVCGIVAALREEKNHDMFIKLAEHCGKKNTDSHYVIVGDGPERERLEAIAGKTEISERIHFTGTRKDIPELLSAFDIFALTSHNEASPVSILEAMSCSRPVIAPDVGSISQAVIDGKTGFLFEKGDFEGAAKRWMQLISNADLMRRMGNDGRQHVVSYGSLESMTEGYQRLVEEIYMRKRDS